MASKSKRRGRVFRASCILAALIIAGSSFAWFTSSDEVTNRLSANADYDVRIVESFAPPKNFIPGQEVNKDVYAVNTGTVAAYVKESVSGVMTITREVKVPSSDFGTLTAAQKAELTELTAAERYVMEAGSYLAFKPAAATTLELGDKIVSMIPDDTDLEAYKTGDALTDFKPTENGLYVFRRSIEVASNRTETFEYEGYYYENGKFYKVELESVTPDKIADIAGVNNSPDGNLTGAAYSFVKDVTTREVPTLTYDAANHLLVATVSSNGMTADQAKDAIDAAAGAYDTAAHEYQLALAKQTVAVKEDNAASQAEKDALAILNNKKALEAAAKLAYDNKVAEYNNKKALYDTDKANLDTATTNKETAQKALYGDDAVTNSNTPSNPPTAVDPVSLPAGLYKDMKVAEAAKDASLADDEAFRQELRNFANKAVADGGLGKTFASNATVADMLAELYAAELVTFHATEQHTQYADYADYLVKKKAYDDKVAEYNGYAAQETSLTSSTATKKAAYESVLVELYGTGTDSVPNPLPDADNQTQIDVLDSSLYKDWKQAVLDTATQQAAYDPLETASENKSTARATADDEVIAAKAALDAAQKAYTEASNALAGTGDIKINIKLENDVTVGGEANKWQILPTTVADNKAEFYLTNILEGGETSVKLIDKVTLDNSVTKDMYKYFDFDLNVELKSAQINYAEDNKTIKTEPATAELGKTPTLITPTDINTGINWA